MGKKTIIYISSILLVAGLFSYLLNSSNSPKSQNNQVAEIRSYEDRAGTSYNLASNKSIGITATIRQLKIPSFPGANAIWGASGRDDQGHIWAGVSTEGENAARLIEYIPEKHRFNDHGDVISALKESGFYEKGKNQHKIHSKIIQGDDGYLYFSSMDEEGENYKTNTLPTWGSNLWRYSPRKSRWEHLFHAPEGLIAVSGMGSWIYALGYWDHVLYQYNTKNRKVRHVRVGSEGGHVSRNIVVDTYGHVYVPRVKYFDFPETAGDESADKDRLLVTTLAEYDQNLDLLSSFPLIHYAGKKRPERYHGITGISYLKDKSVVFVTGTGYLYKINPSQQGPAKIDEIGWVHPNGESYTASIFPIDGKEWLLAVGISNGNNKRKQKVRSKKPEVMLYNLKQRTSQIVDVEIPQYPYLLLYGSNTRDNIGNNYLVGRYDWNKPLIWQLYLESSHD